MNNNNTTKSITTFQLKRVSEDRERIEALRVFVFAEVYFVENV